MTPRRFAAALALAAMVLSGCPCFPPAPPGSPRRMMQAETPPPGPQPVAPAQAR